MLGMIDYFIPVAAARGFELVPAKVTHTLSQDELVDLLPQYEGWIIGDDPAPLRVFDAGKAGRLKAAVKWGIAVYNLDFAAFMDLDIPILHPHTLFVGYFSVFALSSLLCLLR